MAFNVLKVIFKPVPYSPCLVVTTVRLYIEETASVIGELRNILGLISIANFPSYRLGKYLPKVFLLVMLCSTLTFRIINYIETARTRQFHAVTPPLQGTYLYYCFIF